MAERRPGRDRGEAQRILDATEEIMLNDGYAAVSSRSVAAKSASTRRSSTTTSRRSTTSSSPSAAPGRAQRRAHGRGARVARAPPGVVGAGVGPPGHRAVRRALAAANHRPALKAEVGGVARDVRRMQMERLETLLGEYGLDPELPPPLVAAAMQGLAFSAVQDQVAGYDTRPTRPSPRWAGWSTARGSGRSPDVDARCVAS